MRHIQRPLTLKPRKVVRAPVAQDCCHHWLLEPPSGPTSEGTCKLCGQRKTFANWPAYDALPGDWNRWYGGKE